MPKTFKAFCQEDSNFSVFMSETLNICISIVSLFNKRRTSRDKVRFFANCAINFIIRNCFYLLLIAVIL